MLWYHKTVGFPISIDRLIDYAKKEVFIFQLGLPAQASLLVKSAFSSTGI